MHDSRRHLDALFFISVYSGLKCCPSLLDTTGIRVPSRNVRNSSLFSATCKNSPPAKCVTAANGVCEDADIFRKTITSLKKDFALNWGIFKSTYLCFFRV
jgi:ornithine cyclodeaminase/alanine dehydrogenase-like protein (mu-crystallin family)